MQIEHFINQIDLTLDPPAEEPLRQYYFIAKARTLVAQMEKEAGRKMTFCVNTFGCQVNTVHETRKPPILGGFLYGYINYRGTGRKGQDGAAGHADGAFYGVSS